LQHITLSACKGEHHRQLFLAYGSKRERKSERGKERERERERTRAGERESIFFKGMTGALAPFIYLVENICNSNYFVQNVYFHQREL
jgi:hypothetical protein